MTIITSIQNNICFASEDITNKTSETQFLHFLDVYQLEKNLNNPMRCSKDVANLRIRYFNRPTVFY